MPTPLMTTGRRIASVIVTLAMKMRFPSKDADPP